MPKLGKLHALTKAGSYRPTQAKKNNIMSERFRQFTHNEDILAVVKNFYQRQLLSWADFASACEALNNIRLRAFCCNGGTVTVQYNPLRLSNIIAGTDDNINSPHPTLFQREMGQLSDGRGNISRMAVFCVRGICRRSN